MNNKMLTLAIMAAPLWLAACSSDESEPVAPGSELSICTQTKESEMVSVTRTGAESQETQFEQGKIIDVFINEAGTGTGTDGAYTTTYQQPVRARATNGSGSFIFVNGQTGNGSEYRQYFPSSGNGVNIYAWYPSRSELYALTATNKTHSIETDQSTDANYDKSDLMFGVPASNPVNRIAYSSTGGVVPLTFAHKLSKMTVELVAGNGIWQAGTPGTVYPSKLLGAKVTVGSTIKPTVTLSSLTAGTISAASGTNSTVTMLALNNTYTLNGSNHLMAYAVIPPQSMAGQVITVQLTDAATISSNKVEYKYTIPSGITFQSGKEYKFTMTVQPNELKVSTTITDWTTNSSQNTSGNLTIDTAGS